MAEKEYIERGALLNEIEETRPLNWIGTAAEITEQADYDSFENLVKSQPTADVQEVRHGKWQSRYINSNNIYNDWYCSECDYYSDIRNKNNLGNYCPNCGAKMDKE